MSWNWFEAHPVSATSFFHTVQKKPRGTARDARVIPGSKRVLDVVVATVPVGIAQFVQQFEIQNGQMAAAASISTIPALLLMLFGQRCVVQGLTVGTVIVLVHVMLADRTRKELATATHAEEIAALIDAFLRDV